MSEKKIKSSENNYKKLYKKERDNNVNLHNRLMKVENENRLLKIQQGIKDE